MDQGWELRNGVICVAAVSHLRIGFTVQHTNAEASQSPAILASLYYGSRTYSKYGSNAGASSPDTGTGLDEETPLLRDSSGEA